MNHEVKVDVGEEMKRLKSRSEKETAPSSHGFPRKAERESYKIKRLISLQD